MNTVDINATVKADVIGTIEFNTASNLVSSMLGVASPSWSQLAAYSEDAITVTPLPGSGTTLVSGSIVSCGWHVTLNLKPSSSSNPKPALSVTLGSGTVDLLLSVDQIEVSMDVRGVVGSAGSCFHVDPDSVQAAVKISDVTVSPDPTSSSVWGKLFSGALAVFADALLDAVRAYLGVGSQAAYSFLSIAATQKLRSSLMPVAAQYLGGFDDNGKSCTYQLGHACVDSKQPCGPGFVPLQNCFDTAGLGSAGVSCCFNCGSKGTRPCAALLFCSDYPDDCPNVPEGIYEKVLGADGKLVPCTNKSGKTGTVCRLASACVPEGYVCTYSSPSGCVGGASDKTPGVKKIFGAMIDNKVSITGALNSKLSALGPISQTISGETVQLTSPAITSEIDSSMIKLVCGARLPSGACEVYVTLGGLAMSADASVGGTKCSSPLSISFDATLAVVPDAGAGSITFDMSRSCIHAETVSLSVNAGGPKGCSAATNACDKIACDLQTLSQLLASQVLDLLLRSLPPVTISLSSLPTYKEEILGILGSLCS